VSGRPLAVRASALGGLYLVQGLVHGFSAFVLIPTLAHRGVALEAQTGLLALAGLPWVLKLFWGPVVDGAFGGRRSSGAIASVAMLALAVCVAVLGMQVQGTPELTMVAFAWFASNAALSLQDVATDALAFDAVRPDERGRVQAVMLVGHHLGSEAIAGMWLSGVAATHGLGAPLWIIGLVAIVLAGLPVAIATPPTRARTQPIAPVLRGILRERRVHGALALAMLVLVADVVTYALNGTFMVDRLGWNPQDIGPTLAPALLVGTVVGYGLATLLADRIGHRRTTALGCLGLGASWLAFAACEPWWPDVEFMRAFVLVQSIVTAILMAGVHAMLMDVLEPRLRATQFAVLTACLNLPRAWVPLVAPSLLAGLGFVGVFVACGAYQIALVVLVLRVRPRETTAA